MNHAKADEPIEMLFWGTESHGCKELCIMWGRYPLWEGAIVGVVWPIESLLQRIYKEDHSVVSNDMIADCDDASDWSVSHDIVPCEKSSPPVMWLSLESFKHSFIVPAVNTLYSVNFT